MRKKAPFSNNPLFDPANRPLTGALPEDFWFKGEAVLICCGDAAWETAHWLKGWQRDGHDALPSTSRTPSAFLCLPPGESAYSYDWSAVRGLTAVIVDEPELHPGLRLQLATALLNAGAAAVEWWGGEPVRYKGREAA